MPPASGLEIRHGSRSPEMSDTGDARPAGPASGAAVAADLADASFPRLRTSDSVLDAARELVRHGGRLPVVDDDGELVGVFGEKDLLALCFPDCALWPEDGRVDRPLDRADDSVRAAAERPLSEVMMIGSACTAVGELTPAGEVARLMASQGGPVMVVNGRKLVGVIATRGLIGRVLGI